MKIVRSLLKKFQNSIYKILLLHVHLKARYKKILFTESDCLVIVVTFNNIDILRIQHSYLKKFLLDPYDFVVADNSSNSCEAKKIQLFCEKNNISYVRLPWNPLTGIRASGSHGIALNWCYSNMVKKIKPKYFGFLDHDIFPIVNTTILNKIKIGLWGAVRTRKEDYWYLWPGFCFFDFKTFKDYRFNFFPFHGGKDGDIFLDTGGSNYNTIYHNIKRSEIDEATSILVNLDTEKVLQKGEDSKNTFEIIDYSWLHLRQVAWRKESHSKLQDSEKILQCAYAHIRK